MKKKIAIVTPCFNEESNVENVYLVVKKLFQNYKNYELELVFIDNKSTDNTREILRRIAKEDKQVKLIFNARNYGQWASPFHALKNSTADATILLVADLQDPPELINDFIKAWEQGYKTVIGIKENTEGSKLSYFFRKNFYKLINNLSDVELYENFMGFGLYDKQVIKLFKSFKDPEPYFRGIIAEINLKVKKINYTHKIRKTGKSKNNILTLFIMALTAFTSYSKFPLRLIVFFAFSFALISFLSSLFYLIYKLIYWEYFVTGMAPVIIFTSVFLSIIFIFLGIIAEYINSINEKLKDKPLVIEEERINFE